jgi:hypothetical protein
MRVLRLCPVSLAVGLAVLAGAPAASAQDRPKIEPTPQLPQPIKTTAGFVFPADFKNWNPDVFGHNGLYRFRQTSGNCQITFVQNRGADAARAAGRGPQSTLDAYIGGVAARIGKLTRNKAPTLELSRNWVNPHATGERVTFISEEIAYTGNDAVAYHNRVLAQWMGDVELLIIAACPSAEWNRSQNLLDSFLKQVSITEQK